MGKIKILKASAGSGKTYRLAYEYIRNVIASPGSYRHILAVTFTNKATEEMNSASSPNSTRWPKDGAGTSPCWKRNWTSPRRRSAAAPWRPARRFCTTTAVSQS